MICMWCSGDLEIAHRFHEQCINNKQLLMDRVNRIRIDNGNNLEIYSVNIKTETKVNIQEPSCSKTVLSDTDIKKEESKDEDDTEETTGKFHP